MCGIAGILGNSDYELVQTMLSRIKHRGPDDSQVLPAFNYTVGTARLTFTDKRARQPLISNAYSIVFNGEIYNYKKLQNKIAQDYGLEFATDSDTEVILKGYESYGVKFFSELDGMFAFALCKRDHIILVRDRNGIKPLFYTLSNDKQLFSFASEIKALFANESIQRRLNVTALAENFAFGFLLGSNTYFREVSQLEPGSIVHAEINEARKITLSKQTIDGSYPILPRTNFTDAVEELEYLLKESVTSKTHGEHKLGSMLSGGVDSSIVTALLTNSCPHKINTFVSSDYEDCQDVHYSRLLSEHISSTHHEIIIRPRDILNQLPSCILCNEMPTGFNINYLSSKRIKENAKAIISGDGADELFGGYSLYEDPAGVLNHYQTNYAALRNSAIFKDCYLHSTQQKLDELFSVSQTTSTQECVIDFFAKEQLYNWQFLLTDRSSMCNGLEIRLPFVSNDILSFVHNLPLNWKGGSGRKPLLKAVIQKILPGGIGESIALRRKIAAPSSSYLCNSLMSDYAEKLVPLNYRTAHRLNGIFKNAFSILKFDLFLVTFILNSGKIPDDFLLQDLYRTHRKQLSEIVNELLDI